MPDRPNLLLIMSDQHHPRLMGCAGDPLIRTPACDALAAGGVRFSNTYCGSPLCVPSRMTFMTSRHCSDINVWTNSCTLASDVPTFAHSLGAAGYETILGGRMHFTGPDQRHDFHRRLIGDVTASHFGGPGPDLGNIPLQTTGQSGAGVKVAGPGRTAYQAYDRAVVAACQDYLHEPHPQPFCLVAGFVLPHCPFIAPRELYDYYLSRMEDPPVPPGGLDSLPEPIRLIRHSRQLDTLTADEIRHARAAYYALVEYFDTLLGQLLSTLHETSLADNTIVIYTSDHGESAGENGLWCKTTFNEASVGVPLIISGPGLTVRGVRSQNASLLDLGPTMIDLGAAEPLPAVAGRSLLPLLQGHTPPDWPDEVRAELIGYPDTPPGVMVKQGPFKLVHYEGHEPLLYNLADDPHEFTNLAADPGHQSLRDHLHARALAGWNPDRALALIARRSRDLPLLARWRSHSLIPNDPDHWPTPPGSNLWPEP